MIAVCCLCESRRTAPVALFTYRSFDNWPPAVVLEVLLMSSQLSLATIHSVVLMEYCVDRERRSSCETLQNPQSLWQ